MEKGRRTEAREAVELPGELGWEGTRMRVVRRESRVRKAFCSVADVRFDNEVRGDTMRSGGSAEGVCLEMVLGRRLSPQLPKDLPRAQILT